MTSRAAQGAVFCAVGILISFACRDYDERPTGFTSDGDDRAGRGGQATNSMRGDRAGSGGVGDAGEEGRSPTVELVGGYAGGAEGGTANGGGIGPAATGGAPGEPQSPHGTTQGALAPTDFPGLVLWLEPAECIGDEGSRVTWCPDGSGHANDAGQLEPALRPRLSTPGLNGYPVLSFDGGAPSPTNFLPSNLIIPDSPSLRLSDEDFTITLVARWRNSHVPQEGYAGYCSILQKAEPIFPYRGIGLFGNYPTGAHGVPAVRRLAFQLEIGTAFVLSYGASLNDDTYRVYTARRTGGERIEVRLNAANESAAQVASGIDTSAPEAPLLLGGTAGTALRGEIAEVVLIRGPTEMGEIERLELGLLEKFGL